MDHLNQTFSALSDPTRRSILAALAKGPANVTDLAEPFLGHMTLPAVTKHLKVLEIAGLIKKTKEGQCRSCQLNIEPLQAASAWILRYRAMWEQSFDRLEKYMVTISKEPKKGKKK